MKVYRRGFTAALVLGVITLVLGCGGQTQDDSPKTPADVEQGGAEQSTAAPDSDASTSAAAQPAGDPLHPQVALETSMGNITIKLDSENAPLTVENFLDYVDAGHYDGTIFHEVIQDAPKLIIGGGYTDDMTEKPARTPIRNEAHNGLSNVRGTVAMARKAEAIDSATCVFFINVNDNSKALDHTDRTLGGYGYCVFGEVTQGMDVVDRIAGVKTHDTEQFENLPEQTVLIRKATRVK